MWYIHIRWFSTWVLNPSSLVFTQYYGILKADSRQSRWWPFSNMFHHPYQIWVMVSNIFRFHSYLGKIPILTNIFQMGWLKPPTRNWEMIQIWLEHMFHLGGKKSNHQLAVGSPRLTRWRLCLGSEPKGWEIHGVSGPRRAAFVAFVYRFSFIASSFFWCFCLFNIF